MAAEDRTASSRVELLRRLSEEPERWSLYAALRAIEATCLDLPRLGDARKPAEEWIRLGQDPSLEFATSELAGVDVNPRGFPARLLQYNFGLFGPNGPLPIHLTEYVRDRLRNSKDETFARFADLFHHRMLTFFYRAWAAAQPAVSAERAATDEFQKYIGAFVGVASPTTRNADAWPDFAKFHFSGRLGNQSRCPEGIAEVVEDYFGVPAEVAEFVGAWLVLDAADTTRLGQRNTTLGESAVVGALVWDCGQKFRLRVGPMTLADFRRFLPGTGTLEGLASVVKLYFGDQFAWDLNLVLEADEVPDLRLGQRGRLGWTSWLKPRLSREHADEPVLDVMASLYGRLAAVVDQKP
jgi:type VI secretion system protein ImpH